MRERGRGVIGVLLLSFLLLQSGRALAVFGLGVQGGMDQMSIAAAAKNFTLKDVTLASYSRAAIDNPYMVGAFLFIDALPIDIEVAGEVALQRYQVDYSSIAVSYSEQVPWGRASLYVTLRKDIIKLPPIVPVFALYAGGGIGFHYLAPVISENFIYDNLATKNQDLEPPKLQDFRDELKRGFHGLAGIRLKPPVFPLGIKIEGRYTRTGGGDYEQPDSYISIYGGIYTGF